MHRFLEFAESEVRFVDPVGFEWASGVTLKRTWNGDVCSVTVMNSHSSNAVRIKEIVLFKGAMPFNPSTEIYGEGYSKLSQYVGTVSRPRDMCHFSDRAHYRLPIVEGLFTVYNMLLLSPQDGDKVLIAFASCHRFSGEIRFNEREYEIVLDYEGLVLEPGQTVDLEEILFASGPDAATLTDRLGEAINRHHPKLPFPEAPSGWCSWYTYGPEVTESDIYSNLQAIKEKLPELKYVQIDEGYAAYEGDWLDQGQSFPGGIRSLSEKIRELGFEPAIWVGPFLAEMNARVVREHPEWFKQDGEGKPLRSDIHSFGGWYHGPWYMLDGTHPGAQGYLRHVFHTMRHEWKIKYFKMDGTMWGALPFGRHHDPKATRVEAYRAGMKAIREGAGEDSFLLGCNAPIWPSLGTVHGMRLSNDIARNWEHISQIAREMFRRNWQHGKLWINDPDVVVLENQTRRQLGPDGMWIESSDSVTPDEYRFHATAIFASGGMVLSGDSIPNMLPESVEIIRKLLPPVNKAAIFEDTMFSVGYTQVQDRVLVSVLNWEDEPRDFRVRLDGAYRVTSLWTDDLLGTHVGSLELTSVPPHSGSVYVCVPVSGEG
ncbi:glycoside hydrolase family 36 protein [Paenibacillus sacheonensis]|uniref:Alpha-galactosidase n=1 Tax=Paenibacillus sacheonensis TaxID=742054 RepID=A0A7X5BXU6_9BACL|nr:glycoside hydrolase family 36 protein [Paenibacillus sacheonensis]MBM7565893.1 alpha-galactosidase [Paenibacillus sacheonensis]NBC68791.1 alpha-galactosidase [Paenibacillus sacheonensis]